MIDKTKKYWTGETAEDLEEYLRLYVQDRNLELKEVSCRACGADALMLHLDRTEGCVQVVCPQCGTKKLLLDSQDVWADAHPRLRKCSVCKTGKLFQNRVAFQRREDGSVSWVWLGSRCTACGTLGSFLDWKINYAPTDEMEQNI